MRLGSEVDAINRGRESSGARAGEMSADDERLKTQQKADDRPRLFMLSRDCRRCVDGACVRSLEELQCDSGSWFRCSAGTFRLVDGDRYVDVEVYVAFAVFFADLRSEKFWTYAGPNGLGSPSTQASETEDASSLMTTLEEAQLMDALTLHLRERHGNSVKVLKHLPDASS